MKPKIKFTRLIQLWGIVFLLGIGGSIIAVDIVKSYRDFNVSAEQMRAEYTARQKQSIKQEVKRVVNLIRYEKSQSDILTQKKIKSRVNEACAIAHYIYQQNKSSKSAHEIQQMIITALRPVRFEQGKGYYFISRLDGVAILFPSKPELEGKDLTEVQDTHGQYLTKDIIKIVKQSGEGFYQYHWTKPNIKGNDFRKIAFIKGLGLYDWFIGSGLYIDDVEEQIKEELLSVISRIRFGKEGYIFINRLNGDALVSNGKLFSGNKKLWEVFDKNPQEMKNIFQKEYQAALKPDGDYIYYSHIKLTDPSKKSLKASFIYGIPKWQWLVGAGVYLDDVETEISFMNTKLNNQIKKRTLYFTLIMAGIIAFFLLLFSRLNQRLKKDLNLFISFFNRAALSETPIDRTLVQFEEHDGMAENANRMLADRKKTEEALRRSEAKFRGLIESSSDWIWEIDAEGIYTYSSPQVETILGFSAEEVIGKSPFDLMAREDIDRVAAIFNQAKANSQSITALENINLHKDGRLVILETSGVPVLDESGNVIGYRGIDRDITERRKAEKTFQEMEKLKSVGTLAGGIAHDFNNVLMGVFGNISIVKNTLPKDHSGIAYLDEAEKSMNRAIRLTKQLLTFAKGGAPITEVIHLDHLIEDVIRFDLSGSNVKPVFEISDNLWLAEVDRGQIQQVFSNLTINANQAMPDGGHLYITMENTHIFENEVPDLVTGKYIRISVADEGRGIEPTHLDRIFEPYFTTKDAGSGLGLATVHSIIHQHGGAIRVDSQLGKGTTFILYLPASESLQLPETEQPQIQSSTIEHTVRILVMDDEEMIRKVAGQMLETIGFRVVTANEGRQATEMYQHAAESGEPFDLVIMDLTVPGGMGGKEAVRHILDIDPKAKVIVSSGYANDPIMANYNQYGFAGIVAKPYTIGNLLEVINRVLNNLAQESPIK